MRLWSLAAGNTSGRIASRAATSGVEATVWSLSGGRTGAGRGASPKRDSEFVAAAMWRRADSFSQNVSEAGRQTRHDPPDGAQKRKALNFNTKPPYRA